MNSARVYKRHSVISKNECVQIPAGDAKEEEKLNHASPKPVPSVDPDAAGGSDEHVMDSPNPAKTAPQEMQKKPAEKPEPQKAAEIQKPLLDKNALSVIYQKEIEELIRTEGERAYIDALNQEKCDLKKCLSDVQEILDELVQKQEKFVEQYTGELKYMAVDIAEKILLDKIDVDETVLQKLVFQSLKSISNAQWISVELSDRLLGLVDSVKEKLDMSEYRGKSSVVAVSEPKDTCRITTDVGTIVSTISAQAENLRKAFREEDEKDL